MKQIQHNAGPGLVIGIPTLGRPVSIEWAMAMKSLNPPINFNMVFQLTKGQAIDVARNAMAEFALDRGAKYLFFLSDDVVCPGYTLRQLIFRMEQDPSVGVVGGVYCAKCDPPAPLVFRGNGVGSYWDWKIGEYFEVTGLGMDCTLIRTEIFKDIPKPWFKTVESDQFLDGVNNAESWTEDLWFFKELEKTAKWKVMCDAFVICDHYDIYAGRTYSLPPDSLPMRRKVTLKEKKALLLGTAGGNAEELSEYDITTAGSDDGFDYRVSYDALPFDEGQFDKVIVAEGVVVPLDEIQRVTKKAA